MSGKGEIVAAVDFGSHAVRVVIAHRSADGQSRVLGYGSAPARGCVRFGAIQDSNAAVQAFRAAVTDARRMANARIYTLYCGIQGATLKAGIYEGKVQIENGIVKPEHIAKARKNASLGSFSPEARPISCVMSEEWTVDDMHVAEPIDMHGSVLKGRIHFTQLSVFLENNLRACVESQSLEIAEFVFMPLASAYGCLTREDMLLGAAVINMGSASTGISVYHNSGILGATAFNWGSGLIINDVAAGLKVSFEEATELVIEYGINVQLLEEKTKGGFRPGVPTKNPLKGESVPIKLRRLVTGAPSTVSRDKLDEIIFERSYELARKACAFLEDNQYMRRLGRGIVITGGGASIMKQDILMEMVSDVPTRIGVPTGFDELPEPLDTPEWAPVIGILNYAYAHRRAAGKSPAKTSYGGENSLLTPIRRFIEKYVI